MYAPLTALLNISHIRVHALCTHVYAAGKVGDLSPLRCLGQATSIFRLTRERERERERALLGIVQNERGRTIVR